MEKDFKWRAFNSRYTQYGVTPYSRTVTGRTQKAVNVSTQTKRHTTAPLHKNRVINQPRSIHTFYIEYRGFNWETRRLEENIHLCTCIRYVCVSIIICCCNTSVWAQGIHSASLCICLLLIRQLHNTPFASSVVQVVVRTNTDSPVFLVLCTCTYPLQFWSRDVYI